MQAIFDRLLMTTFGLYRGNLVFFSITAFSDSSERTNPPQRLVLFAINKFQLQNFSCCAYPSFRSLNDWSGAINPNAIASHRIVHGTDNQLMGLYKYRVFSYSELRDG